MIAMTHVVNTFPSAKIISKSGGLPVEVSLIAQLGLGSGTHLFESIALLSCNPYHSPWGIAFNEAQRMAIEAGIDADGNVNPLGLEAARGLAMLSYRNYITFDIAQSETEEKIDHFKVSSYQRYQGNKLSKRFDAYAYMTLSKAMDSHHVGRGRGGVPHALSLIKAKTAVIGINTDILFPLSEQLVLADYIPNASFYRNYFVKLVYISIVIVR